MTRLARILPHLLVLAACALAFACNAGEAARYDLLIRGAQLIDPQSLTVETADIAVTGERIAAIGDLASSSGTTEIDARGLHVAPGFIDTHSHTASALISKDRSHAEALLRQGITTVVLNPDGGGPTDLAEQRQQLREHGLGVNVSQMIGHGSLRAEVIGMEDRPATPDELKAMQALVRAAMEQGAVGLSSGPFYAPGSYADTDELTALASVAAEFGGVYQSHIRDESNYTIGLEAAVEEVIEVAERSGAIGIVTHIKALGPPVWGSAPKIVELIEAARERGVAIFADQYPYPASATGLAAALVPRWAQTGGHEAFLERVRDPAQRTRIEGAMTENLARRGGPDRIVFRHAPERREIEGRPLQEVAEEEGKDSVELALELLEQAKQGDVGIVSFNMNEGDIRAFMKTDWTLTASDGAYPPWGEGVPHPRGFGTFPRRIRHYALDEPVLPLEETIRSMTSLPAQVFGLKDRGALRVGAIADLVLFDKAQIRDQATFEEPYQMAEGISWVILNGRVALGPDGLGSGPGPEAKLGLILKH